MTKIETAERRLRRGGIALALLATTAALAGGVQALAPATAAAAINEGEECSDSTGAPIECDTTGGGGGGGGTTGGGTVGSEVIVVEGKAPLCTTCMPSEIGGRRPSGVDGFGQKTHGRHGGRPTRVAQAPGGKLRPTWDECKKAMAGQFVHPLDRKMARYAGLIKTLDGQIHGLFLQIEYLQSERTRLERLHAPASAAQGFTAAIGLIERQQFELATRRFEMSQTYSTLKRARDGDMASLKRNCEMTYGDALDD